MVFADLSNLTSRINTKLNNAGVSSFRLPSNSRSSFQTSPTPSRTRVSAPSIPRQESNFTTRFKDNFAKFRTQNEEKAKKFRSNTMNVINSLDRDKNKAGFQLISPKLRDSARTVLRDSAQGYKNAGQDITKFFGDARKASPIADRNYVGSNLQKNIQGATNFLTPKMSVPDALERASSKESVDQFRELMRGKGTWTDNVLSNIPGYTQLADFGTARLTSILDSAQKAADTFKKNTDLANERTDGMTFAERVNRKPEVDEALNLLRGTWEAGKAYFKTTGGGVGMETLGAGFNVLFGDKEKSAGTRGGEGAADAAGLKMVLQYTNPATEWFVSKVGGGWLMKQLLQRTVGGTANVGEDRIINYLDDTPEKINDTFSFLFAFALTGNNDVLDIVRREFANAENLKLGGEIPTGLKQRIVRQILNSKDAISDRLEAFSKMIGTDVLKTTEQQQAQINPEAQTESFDLAPSRIKKDFAPTRLSLQKLTWTDADGKVQTITGNKADIADRRAWLISQGIDAIQETVDTSMQNGLQSSYRGSIPIEDLIDPLHIGRESLKLAQKLYNSVVPVAKEYGLTQYTPEEYASFKSAISSDGQTGYSVKPDGELVSVFNTGKKGQGAFAVEDAIENGATKLDAFDAGLVEYYERFGFREIGRMAWDDKYAPDGWDYKTKGRPDIVEMELDKGAYDNYKQNQSVRQSAKGTGVDGGSIKDRPVFETNFRADGSRFTGTEGTKVGETTGSGEVTPKAPVLPDSLSKAQPRYNYGSKAFVPKFDSDIDKALYISAQTKKSANDAGYRKFLTDNGFTDAEIDAKGQDIRAAIKAFAKDAPGGTYQKPEVIEIKDQGFRTDFTENVQATPETPKDAFEQQLKNRLAQVASSPEASLPQKATEPEVNPNLLADAQDALFGKDTTPSVKPAPEAPAPKVNEPEGPPPEFKNPKVSKLYNSMMETETLSPEYKSEFLKDKPDRFYDAITNKDSISRAAKRIDEVGFDNVAKDLLRDGVDLNNPQSVADALVIHKMFDDVGNKKAAKAVYGILMDSAHRSGQSTQMFALVDKLGPSGMVEMADAFIIGKNVEADNSVLGRVYRAFGADTRQQDGNIKDRFLNKLGFDNKITQVENTTKEIDSVVTGLEAELNNLPNDTAKKQLVNKLINESPTLKKNVKNKTELIDTIVRMANKSDQDSLFNLADYSDIKTQLQKEFDIPHMDQKFADHVYDEAVRIKSLTDVAEQQKASRALIKEINEKVPLTVQEVHRAMRYNNVLSGMGTHARNMYENMFNIFIKQPVLIGLEEASHGRFVKAITEPVAFYKDVINNISDGKKGFKESMRGEIYPDKMTLQGERNALLPEWMKISTKFLEASDQLMSRPLRAAIEGRYLRQGASPEVAANRAQIESDQILYRGKYDPNNKTGQGELLSSMDSVASKVEDLVRRAPFGDRIVMFPRIATQITKAGVELSPIGFATAKGNYNPRMQRIKATLGTTFLLSAFGLAAQGKARGAAPEDEKSKEAFYAEGPAWSIQIGNKWIPMKYFGPLSLSMKMGVYLQETFMENPDTINEGFITKAMTAGLGLISLVSDETYMQGITNVIELLNSSEGDKIYRMKKWFGQTMEQEIPFSGFLAWANQFLDPVKRKGGKEWYETTLRRMPGASIAMDSYTTPEGDPTTVGFNDPVLDKLNPFLPYGISNVNPEYSDIVDERNATRIENKQIKAEESADDPNLWERMLGASASDGTAIAPVTDIPKITTADQGTEPTEKTLFQKLFPGKEEKTPDQIYQVGEMVTEYSDDTMDVRALSNGQTFRVPKEQAPFDEKYKDITKVLEGYEEDYNDIMFDDTKSALTKKKELRELEAKALYAQEANAVLEEHYPEQVFDAQISTYGKGHPQDINTEMRGEWATSKLFNLLGDGEEADMSKIGGDEWQAMVNKLWDGGVLTTPSNGTLAYILDTYGSLKASDFKYTGDDEKMAKKANKAASGGSGSGKKKNFKFTIPKTSAISPQKIVELKIAQGKPLTLQDVYLTVGRGLSEAPNQDYLRIKAPNIAEGSPTFQRAGLRVSGLT